MIAVLNLAEINDSPTPFLALDLILILFIYNETSLWPQGFFQMSPLLPTQNNAKNHADNTCTAFSPLSEVWLLQMPALPWTPEQSSPGWKGRNRGFAQNP